MLFAVGAAAAYGWQLWHRPVNMAAERIEFRVAPGSSARVIAQQLQRAGIDLPAPLFVLAARATGTAKGMRAGRYVVEQGTTLQQLLEKLGRGEVQRERLTVVEGWTFADLRAALAAQAEVRHDSDRLSDAQIMAAVGAPTRHPEGMFAPDTYVFDAGASDLEVLRQAYRAQAARLAQAWQARAADLPYSDPYEVLIMASIVEKETGQSDERRRIAGVFVNRQRRGMLLQTDPTVIYGLGDRFDGNLRRRDLQTDGPYNTYTRVGLPPTPIALPGQAALAAAVDPEPTRALYFVARGDRTSQFSETLAEHQRAVERYQRNGGAP